MGSSEADPPRSECRVGGGSERGPGAAHEEVELAAEAEVEARVEQCGDQGEADGDVEDGAQAQQRPGEGADGEAEADGLGEPGRSLVLERGRRGQPGSNQAAEEPAVGLVAQPEERAGPDDFEEVDRCALTGT